jgi:hypothetical protein
MAGVGRLSASQEFCELGFNFALMRWETLIEEYRAAIAALEAGDSSLIQVFENSRLGKVYSGRVEKIEAGELYARREVF